MALAPLKIIYAGTPDFAVMPLQSLLDSEHLVCAVYTQPDRPAGRGRKLTASPVKQRALEHDIPVFQPQKLKSEEDINTLVQLNADLMVVAAYGLILPKIILDAPKFGCINIHASLLPRWRGAAPIQRAILAGDKQTGVTIMQMDVGLDTGDMLLTRSCPIDCDDSAQVIHDRLSEIGAAALIDTLPMLMSGTLHGIEQNETEVTYAEKLKKDEARIDWQDSAAQINRQVHAYNPWPVAQTQMGKDVLRIWNATVDPDKITSLQPGRVIKADKMGIDVATGEGVLTILKLQAPGKKALDAQVFINSRSMNEVIFDS